jgi:hypothetical protein
MQEVNSQARTTFVSLKAAYQAAWCHYLAEVSRWQSLQNERQPHPAALLEAERAADAAEEQYRHARNMLADYMLERVARARAPVLAEFHRVRPFETGRSACLNHA